MKKLLFVAAACGAGLLAPAEPVDGFQWGQAWWAPYSALVPQYWQNGVVAKDGGVAYFLGSQSSSLDFSAATIWRGIDFGNVKVSNNKPQILGGKLTLTGEAFISGDCSETMATVDSTVSGTGANTLTKHGGGRLAVNVPFANFATLAAGGGFLCETAFSDETLFATAGTRLAVRGGTFDWSPTTNTTETAAQGAVGDVTYGMSGGALAWAKGLNASATLTLASLTPEAAAGNTLSFEPSGGAATLGETEKLLVTTPPEMVNGLLDPGIVTRETGVESAPIRFTAYDAEKGVVAYPVAAMKPLAEAGATDVAVVTATNALETSTRVAALSIENTANLAISNGVTLTVGDGEHPAGVALNFQNKINSDAAYVLKGEGTLDFGASPGVIWAASPSIGGSWGGNRQIKLGTRVTGSAGVTFAGRLRAHTERLTPLFLLEDDGLAAWTGPTRVSGAMLWCKPTSLPAGDIYVESGSGYGGDLRLSINGTLNQNLFLSGCGPYGDSTMAFELPSGFTTLNGTVTLTGDTWIGSMIPGAGGIKAYGSVRGPGSLVIQNAGTFNFYTANTYRDLIVKGNNTAVNLITNGTFGTGRVWVRAKTFHFAVQSATDCVIANPFRCDYDISEISVERSKLTLNTDVAFAKTTIKNFSTLAIGGAVDIGQANITGGRDASKGSDRITASKTGAELRVGTGDDGVLAAPLSDGDGTLALTKKGAATVELPAVERTYTGPTSVKAGTLKLNDDPLTSRSIVWWLDASREEDFTKNANGVITEWRPRAGSGNFVFTEASGGATWGTAEKVNGHNVVTMTEKAQFKGNKKAWHRTVFIVCRFKEMRAFACLFGAPSTEIGECGVRISASSNPVTVSGWDLNNVAHYNYNTTGSTRQDAGTSYNTRNGEVHVLTTFHDRDGWPTPFSWASPTTQPYFTPLLNYYGSSRPFIGDYMEVIAYDRVLTEAETRRVENYLSEKWQGVTRWRDDQIAKPAALPAATALDVATDATLDLNGVSVTVAALSGNGTITNSSSKAATLTVTGDSTFTGRIGGLTTVRAGGETLLGAAVDDGATFAATEGSTLEVSRHILAPATNGLAYWCDAARPETIVTNASGQVTKWLSRASSSATALVNDGRMPAPNGAKSKSKPLFTESSKTAMAGGRPGVCFPVNGQYALWADVMTQVRTVFLVYQRHSSTGNCPGVWGLGDYDCGFRFNGSLEGSTSVVRPTTTTDRVVVDAGGEANSFDTVHVLSARMGSTDAAYFNNLGLGETPYRTTAIGAYCGNPAIEGYIGEVIAYDRVLSDSEMLAVEAYLMNKWKGAPWTDGQPPAEDEAVFANGGGLAVEAGATVTATDGLSVGTLGGGGTITGDVTADGIAVAVKPDGTTDTLTLDGALTLADGATLTVSGQEHLTSRIVNTYLRATSITGRFAETNLGKRNATDLTATEARLYRVPGLTVIVR